LFGSHTTEEDRGISPTEGMDAKIPAGCFGV